MTANHILPVAFSGVTMDEVDEVIGFIKRRFPADCGWTSGNCFYFAMILKARFPWAVVMYDAVDGHFVVDIGGVKYDWTGVVPAEGRHEYVEWSRFCEYDSERMRRIVEGCIK